MGSKNTGEIHRQCWRWPVDTVFVFSVQQHVLGCSEQIAPDWIFPLKYVLWVCSFFTLSASTKTASDGSLEENPISSTRTAVGRDYRCFIAAAVYLLTFFQEWLFSPSIRSFTVPVMAVKEILSKILTLLLMRYYYILKNLCPWKTKLVSFILLTVTVVQCVGGFLWIYMALTLSFSFSSGWQKLVNASPWNEVIIEERSSCLVKSTLCLLVVREASLCLEKHLKLVLRLHLLHIFLTLWSTGILLTLKLCVMTKTTQLLSQ